MSGFHNPLQMNPNTYQVFPYPGHVHPNLAQSVPWVDGSGQNVGFPTGYASAGYQQMNGQLVYPVNIVQSSPRFASAMNPNHLPPVFQDALPSPTTLWNPGGVVLQSQPNLLNPVTLTNPMVANPQFLPHNFHSSPDQLMAQSIAVTSSMTPVTYAVAPQQPLNMSLTQLNASYQQQIVMLQQQLEQQQQQKKENEKRHLLQQQIEQLQQQLLKQQEQHKQEQHHNLQQQQLEQLQQQLHKQQELQKQEQHQKLQLEQQQDEQLKDQQEQQVVPEQQNEEQEPPEQASNEESSEDPFNNNTITTQKDANQNITSTQQEAIVPSTPTERKHTPTVQAAASETQPGGTGGPRQNPLPATFPTSLNPSLKVQMQSTPVTTVSSQKTDQTSNTSQAEVGLIQLRLAKKEFQGSHNGPERSPSLSSPESPTSSLKTDLPEHHIVLKPIYEKPKHKHDCLRCNKKVYHMEKTGPIKDVVYHKSCFTCVRCGTILTVKNFHHNPNDADDLSVFCTAHKPKERTLSCDASAVHIKSALSVPKLDRVNEQIRSDRHPSEVLTRRRSSQVAGIASTTTEYLYYGMDHLAEPVTSGGAHQSQQEDRRHKPHQLEQQEQPNGGEHNSSKQKHHEETTLQHSSNMKLTHLETDKKRINELGNIKFVRLTQNGETNSSTSDINGAPSNQPLADDALFLRNSILPVLRGDAHPSPSFLPSSITQQDITATDSVEQYLATHFKLDNHKNWVKLNDNHFSPGETKVVPERERASMQSSRSTSPMQVQTSSRSTDDSESRSSYSSNVSSRESVDLGVSAGSYNGRQQQLRSGNERADRPSSFIIAAVSDEPNRNPSSRTDEKTKTSNSQEVKLEKTDTDRFLPKNERMRMDRPSQYS